MANSTGENIELSPTQETRPEKADAPNVKVSTKRAKKRDVRNMAYLRAVDENRPNPWGKGHLLLYWYCSIVYLCSTMNGYDNSLMGSINSLKSYQDYYNLPLNGASTTGIVFAIYPIGQMAGAFFAWIADWRGRRWHIFLGSLGTFIGVIVTATATSLSTFIAGRFLLSFFSSWCWVGGPLLVIELAPPQYRATVSGMYNTLWYLGSMIASFAVYGSNMHYGDSNLAFRVPLWLQMLCPGLALCLIWTIPESPRWLIAAGRHDEARDIFVKLHANGDVNHPVVELQMAEVYQSLRDIPLQHPKTFFDLRTLFNTRARRYRTFLNFVFSWFGQFSGNNVISYYLPLLLYQVGIVNPNTQILLNVVYAITGWIAATLGARFHDIVGRRKMFLGGTAAMAICLAIAAGGSAGYVKYKSVAASDVGIAFIFAFGVSFAFAYTSMQPIYPAEVMTNDMRAKGMFLNQCATGVAGFVNTFVAPIALKKVGYWVYVFFVFWDCFEFAVIYFYFVETKGRTLEQLNEVFDDPKPARKSKTIVEQVIDVKKDAKQDQDTTADSPKDASK